MHLKKSKIISLYKILILIITFLSLILILIYKDKSLYTGEEKSVNGIVYSCKYSKDKTVIKIKAKENILINYYDYFPCKLGIKVKATGAINKPSNNTNFYLFNYRKYLLSEKIHYILKADKIQTLNNDVTFIYKIKNKIYKHINEYKSKAYLQALILGDSKDIEDDITESYRINGISHLLAISGFQITLLSSIIIFILSKFLSKNVSLISASIFLLFYLFISSASPSILRAVTFFNLLSLNKILNIKIKTIYVLLLTFDILILINPYYIYNLGFILSFTVSFYLILFKKIINSQKSYFLKTLNMSVISFLSSSVILINNFFSLNILSPLINLYFAPLMMIIYLIAILTFFIKPFDILLLKGITLLENASLFFSKITFLNITLCHINIIFIVLYYIIITITLYFYQKNKLAIFIFFSFLFLHHNINNIIPSSFVTVIDVKQGDSILLKHNNKNILIDTGGLIFSSYNITKNITSLYLKSEGIDKINYLIITHGDYDHMGEAINLVDTLKIENVIFNCGKFNELENKLIKVLDKKNIKYFSCINELNIDDYRLKFLNTTVYNDENTNSSVIYLNYNNKKFLFMGDASKEKEYDILKKYNLRNIDFLKVGHHGSNTSSSKEFVTKINPKYSLISVGKNNMYHHPRKEVLDVLKNSKIYRTDLSGSIKINLNKNNYDVYTCRP